LRKKQGKFEVWVNKQSCCAQDVNKLKKMPKEPRKKLNVIAKEKFAKYSVAATPMIGTHRV